MRLGRVAKRLIVRLLASTPVAFLLTRKMAIMHLCYMDESGTSDIPGNTSHFILAGLSVPIWKWKDCDQSIEAIKRKYALEDSEIHVAWILRPYIEQTRIANFDKLDYTQRRYQVETLRKAELLRLQRVGNPSRYAQTKKNYEKTKSYIHLSRDERQKLTVEIAHEISQWGFARLFAECIDKVYFDPSRSRPPQTVDEQAFEQLISRFSLCVYNRETTPAHNLECKAEEKMSCQKTQMVR